MAQKGTKLEDRGDAWRIRYNHYFIDEGGARKSKRETQWFYKHRYPTEELAQKAAAKLLRDVNEANRRIREATARDAPLQARGAIARLGAEWLADTPAVTQGLAPLHVPIGEFQRCRRVTLRNGRLFCEIDKMATYSLAEAYEQRPHILLAVVDSDQQLIDFIRDWGPLKLTDSPIALGDSVENSLADSWLVQRGIKGTLDALRAFKLGRGEREALIRLMTLEIDLYGKESAKKTLEHMGKTLGIPGDVLEWAEVASIEGVREALDYMVDAGLWLSCTLHLRSDQDGSRRVRAGWNLGCLENALHWMIWWDEFTGRTF